MCLKRGYPSRADALRANRHIGSRLRAYWCEEHRAWHVTNAEKRWQRMEE
jgi:hypothetical protein